MQTGLEPYLAGDAPFLAAPFFKCPVFQKGHHKILKFSENYQSKFQPGFWMRNALATRLFCCPKSDRPDHTYIDGTVSLHYAYTNGLLTSVTRGGYYWTNGVKSTKQSQTYSMAYDTGATPPLSVWAARIWPAMTMPRTTALWRP